MNQNSIIIFVCEHGAAKSVVAAAYFNQLASEKHLSLRAIARGTRPDQEFSSEAIAGLQKDGLAPAESVPIRLTQEEMESAQQVVSFCELPEEYRPKGAIEHWAGVPPVSENYTASRDAIVERIHKLIHHL
jgi:protein-tyrosine-phosphatase